MDLPKKIVTAREIALKILKKNNYDFDKITDYSFQHAMAKHFEGERKAWLYVLNGKEDTLENKLDFYMISKQTFNRLSEYDKKVLILSTPNKNFLEFFKCPKDRLDKADKANTIAEEYKSELKQLVKIIELRRDIINCLEVLVLENKLKILGEWQGEDTRIIINDWEEIDQLFDINSISQKENENKIEGMLNLSLSKRKQWEDTISALKFENKEECEILYYFFHKEILKEDLGTIELNAPKEIKCSQTKIKYIAKKGLEIVKKYKLPLPLALEDSK